MRVDLPLRDGLYAKVAMWAAKDGISVEEWIERAADREEVRRRCIGHAEWLAENPDIQQDYLDESEAAELDLEDALNAEKGTRDEPETRPDLGHQRSPPTECPRDLRWQYNDLPMPTVLTMSIEPRSSEKAWCVSVGERESWLTA
jgi:hypothetical protein